MDRGPRSGVARPFTTIADYLRLLPAAAFDHTSDGFQVQFSGAARSISRPSL